MEKTVEGLTEANNKMEKAEAIRQEKERLALIDSIWKEKLSESEIPERLFGKVRAQVSHEKFIKEGEFDMEGLKKAIEKEIADWVEAGVKTSVLGKGFSEKEAEEKASAEEDKKWVEDMKKRTASATK